jgi:hypothetical protein
MFFVAAGRLLAAIDCKVNGNKSAANGTLLAQG